MRTWGQLSSERYKVISELGLQGLKELVKLCEENKKKYGHYNYTQAIKDLHTNHLESNREMIKDADDHIKEVKEWAGDPIGFNVE